MIKKIGLGILGLIVGVLLCGGSLALSVGFIYLLSLIPYLLQSVAYVVFYGGLVFSVIIAWIIGGNIVRNFIK